MVRKPSVTPDMEWWENHQLHQTWNGEKTISYIRHGMVRKPSVTSDTEWRENHQLHQTRNDEKTISYTRHGMVRKPSVTSDTEWWENHQLHQTQNGEKTIKSKAALQHAPDLYDTRIIPVSALQKTLHSQQTFRIRIRFRRRIFTKHFTKEKKLPSQHMFWPDFFNGWKKEKNTRKLKQHPHPPPSLRILFSKCATGFIFNIEPSNLMHHWQLGGLE